MERHLCKIIKSLDKLRNACNETAKEMVIYNNKRNDLRRCVEGFEYFSQRVDVGFLSAIRKVARLRV